MCTWFCVQSTARRSGSDEMLLVKAYPKEWNGTDAFVPSQRCQRELDVLTSLTSAPHAALVSQFVVVDEPEQVLVVMPYGSGRDLVTFSEHA
jgi:hypothetical protein